MFKRRNIKIATRKSPLSIWQSEFVKKKLLLINPELNVELLPLSTEGDNEKSRTRINSIGKTFFVKELQKTLLDYQSDIAVHSIKDLSVYEYPGLKLAAFCERGDPRDAFISKFYSNLIQLPNQAIIGTGSPRRISLLKEKRPDLNIKIILGNVGTRLEKLDGGQYDAIVLAAAGLQRLNLSHRIQSCFDPNIFIPAIGQAAIGVECRSDDEQCLHLLSQINHNATQFCILAEQHVNRVLGGNCHTAVGAHAVIKNTKLSLRAVVGSMDGTIILRDSIIGNPNDATLLGQKLGEKLLERGADSLISSK